MTEGSRIDPTPLQPGLYEALVTDELSRQIEELRDRAQVGSLQRHEAPRILAAGIAEVAVRVPAGVTMLAHGVL